MEDKLGVDWVEAEFKINGEMVFQMSFPMKSWEIDREFILDSVTEACGVALLQQMDPEGDHILNFMAPEDAD
jgi:hypothetical protein